MSSYNQPLEAKKPQLKSKFDPRMPCTCRCNFSMVRRRSTVRFRNGAPGHRQFSNDPDEWRGLEPGRRSLAPSAAKAPIAQRESGWRLLKVAVGGAVAGPAWSPSGRGHAGRPSRCGRFQASMSRIRSRVRFAAADVIRLGRPGINECLDHGRESGMGGDERGQDADPPVHAVRVRDVLRLDGPRGLLGASRTVADVRALCTRISVR